MSSKLVGCHLSLELANLEPADFEKEFGVIVDEPVYSKSYQIWYISIGSFFEQDSEIPEIQFEGVVNFLRENSDKMRTLGVKEILLYIYYSYKGECNVSFPNFSKFSAFIDDLCISCYEEE